MLLKMLSVQNIGVLVCKVKDDLYWDFSQQRYWLLTSFLRHYIEIILKGFSEIFPINNTILDTINFDFCHSEKTVNNMIKKANYNR